MKLGAATVSRVVESRVDNLPQALFPHTPPEAWHQLAQEFSPTFWTDAGWRIALQTWVIEADGLTVLVDTGAGNGRDRPAMPPLNRLTRAFSTSSTARASLPSPSTSSSTPICTPTTSAGTPGVTTTPGSPRFPTRAT